MQLEVHHIGIIVSDLDRSKAFYESLGFEVVTERDDGTKTICFLELEGFKLELFAYAETPPAVSCEDRVIGFRHLALRTEDMEATVSELRAAGIIGPDTVPHEIPGLARLVFFRDPDGIEIEITQDLGA